MATDPDPPRRRRAVTHAEPPAPAPALVIRNKPAPAAKKRKPGPAKAVPLKPQLVQPKRQGRQGATHDAPPDTPLNHQQMDFVAYYLADPKRVIYRAARAAGYGNSDASAARAGTRLLTYPAIIAEIERRQAPVLAEMEVTAADVIRELGRLGMSNMLDYGRVERGEFIIDLSDVTRAQAAAIQEVKVTRRTRTVGDVDITENTTALKLASKREALSELGRHFGLFREDAGAAAVTVQFIVAGHPKAGLITLTLEDESNG